MCGRFTLSVDDATLKRHLRTHYSVDDAGIAHTPRYNIAPSQMVLTIIRHNGTHRVGEIPWGFVGLHSSHKPLINARSEQVEEKPTFKRSFARRRCLVLSDGFYEWDRGKTPYHITPQQGVVAFAAIYSKPTAHSPAGVAILTKGASDSMAGVHPRMPVMLSVEAAKAYLRGESLSDMNQWTRQHAIARVHTTPVHSMVGNPANDTPAIFTK